MNPRIMIVLIEWRPSKQKVTVRGCWPRAEYDHAAHKILEPGNIQHAVQVFEGVDMERHVGFEGLVEAKDPQPTGDNAEQRDKDA